MWATKPKKQVPDWGMSQASEGAVLKEIHHQVKNNLQVVCSLLRLQSRHLSDVEARAAFKRSEERIQSMALVYDKLYRAGSIFDVPFDEYISELANQMLRSRSQMTERISFVSELEPVLITSKAATTCGLIVSELLALRLGAFEGGMRDGVMRIRLFHDTSRIFIELTDNGHLWDPQMEEHGLEMQIVRALVSQLQGAIEFSGSQDASCQLSFPREMLQAHA